MGTRSMSTSPPVPKPDPQYPTPIERRQALPDESIEMSKNKAYLLLERWEAALAAGEITEEDWYREMQAIFTPAYLAAETPWGQSGKLGDQAAWEYARSLIADAVDRSGTFLDVGCASGYLMECL